MNNKIPFGQFATMVAKITGKSEVGTETFLKDFFDLIAQNVVAGETVKIKGLGTFAPTGNPEHPVSFTADEKLASAVNAPFELFAPETLSPEVTDDILEDKSETVERTAPKPANVKQTPSPVPAAEPTKATQPKPVKPETPPTYTPQAPVEKPVVPDTPQVVAQPPVAPIEDNADNKIEPTADDKTSSRLGLGIVIGLIIGIAIGACSVFFYFLSVGLT